MSRYRDINITLASFIFDSLTMNELTWSNLVLLGLTHHSGRPTLLSRHVELYRNIPVHRVVLKFEGRDVGHLDLEFDNLDTYIFEASWVSVHDAMPENRGMYLTFQLPERLEVCYLNREGEWIGGNNARNGVTHWMVLPDYPLGCPDKTPEPQLPKRRVRKN